MVDHVEPAARPPSAEPTPSRWIAVRIEGMTGTWCARRLAAALNDVPGVASVHVDLLAEIAWVEAGDIPAGLLVDTVRRAGFDGVARSGSDAAVPKRRGGAAADASRAQEQRLREHRQSMATALGMGLPIIGLAWAAPALSGTHTGAHFWPTSLQALLGLLLFISPAGGPILANGLRAIHQRRPSQDLLITVALLMAVSGGLASMVLADAQALNHLPTAALALILVHIGRYLELKARHRLAAGLNPLAVSSDERRADATGVGALPDERKDFNSWPAAGREIEAGGPGVVDGFSTAWLAETAAALLVPVTLVVAGVAGLIWLALAGMGAALSVAIAVLLAASVRGVALVVPAATAVGIGDLKEGPGFRQAVWQNLVIASVISDGGVILAAIGVLVPGAAPAFMMVGSLAVLANSLRLRRQ
jgi:cation transport ATPase